MIRSPHWVTIDYLVQCRRCGESGLAWQQSARGKWYLCCARFNRAAVRFEADRTRFQNCPVYESRETSSVSPPRPSPELIAWMQRIVSAGYHGWLLRFTPTTTETRTPCNF